MAWGSGINKLSKGIDFGIRQGQVEIGQLIVTLADPDVDVPAHPQADREVLGYAEVVLREGGIVVVGLPGRQLDGR